MLIDVQSSVFRLSLYTLGKYTTFLVNVASNAGDGGDFHIGPICEGVRRGLPG